MREITDMFKLILMLTMDVLPATMSVGVKDLCSFTPRTVTLQSPAGMVHGDFSPIFLRENTHEAFTPSSRHRKTHSLPGNLTVTKIKSMPSKDGAPRFKLSFSDDHVGNFRVPTPHKKQRASDLRFWPRELWGDTAPAPSDEVAKGSLRFRFDAICGPEQSPMIRAQWIEAMHRFGITIIEGVPEQVDAGRTFAKAAGGMPSLPSVHSEHGPISLRGETNATNIAYSTQPLQMHTDNCYMSRPPSITMVHCLLPATEGGGGNAFVDGFDAARTLHRQDPEAFDLLSKTRLRFSDIKPDWQLTAKHATLKVDEDADVADLKGEMPPLKQVVFDSPTRDSFGDWDHDRDVIAVEHALWKYERLLDNPDRWLHTMLKAGEMVVVDNHRLLHLRKSFHGKRHVVVHYMEWDTLYGRWRVDSGNHLATPAVHA